MPPERRNSNARTSPKLPKCHLVISFHIFPRICKLILGLHHYPVKNLQANSWTSSL
ncbi:hypothetical protein Scep_016778 [Stephania cephalantha]|uniref:Uncharacterized protein n=1 Tax=Stephania cephalantha TaxID=152367 RepID=A0AAP0INU4_9MAGN